jgi:hypothetical protein
MPNRTQLNGSYRSARQRVGGETTSNPIFHAVSHLFSFPLFSSSSIYLHFAYQMLGVANKV